MALPPNKLPGYVNIKNLEKYIDDCLKTGKYDFDMGYFFVEIPVNLVNEDMGALVASLKDKYITVGWATFDTMYDMDHTAKYFRLGL